MLVSSILSQSWEGEEKRKLEVLKAYSDEITYLLIAFQVVFIILRFIPAPKNWLKTN